MPMGDCGHLGPHRQAESVRPKSDSSGVVVAFDRAGQWPSPDENEL